VSHILGLISLFSYFVASDRSRHFETFCFYSGTRQNWEAINKQHLSEETSFGINSSFSRSAISFHYVCLSLDSFLDAVSFDRPSFRRARCSLCRMPSTTRTRDRFGADAQQRTRPRTRSRQGGRRQSRRRPEKIPRVGSMQADPKAWTLMFSFIHLVIRTM
jgi:hypothetical protein